MQLSSTGAVASLFCATEYSGVESPASQSCICNRGFSGPLCSVVSTAWIRAQLTLTPLDSSDETTIIPRARMLQQNIESTVTGAANRTRMIGFGYSRTVDNWSWAQVSFSADPTGRLTAEQLFDRFYARAQDSGSPLRRTELGAFIATISIVICPGGSCPDGKSADMFATPDPTPETVHVPSSSVLDDPWFLLVVICSGVLLMLLLLAIVYRHRKRAADAAAAAARPPPAAVALRFSKNPHQSPDVLVSTAGGGSVVGSQSAGSGGSAGGATRKGSRSGGDLYDTTLAAANREKSLSKRWLELASAGQGQGQGLPPRPHGPSPALASRSLGQHSHLYSSNSTPIASRQGTPKLATRSLQPPHSTLITHGSGISITVLTASPSPVAQHSDGQHSDGHLSDGSRSSQMLPVPRAPVRMHLEDAASQV